MAVYTSQPLDGAVSQASQDDAFISTSVHTSDLCPSQDLTTIMKSEEDISVLEMFEYRSTPSTLRYVQTRDTSPIDMFRYRLLYLNQATVVSELAQGLITQDAELNVSIWNGWEESTTIEQLDVTSGQGVYVDNLFVGNTITALQELPLTITVLGVGSAIVDATISIRLGVSLEVFELHITGTRVVVPYLLDAEWGSDITVTKRYLTSVFTGRNMSETRVSQRSNPVRSIEAPLFFGSRNSSLQALASMNASATAEFLMPYVPDRSETTQTPSTSIVYIDTLYKRFYVGSYAIIAHRDLDGTVLYQDAIKILEKTDTYIVAEFELQHQYSKGDDVYPGVFCIPAFSGSGLYPVTGAVGLLNLSATEIYGSTMLPRDNPDYTPTTRLELPVYPFKVNWNGSVEQTVTRGGFLDSSGSGQKYAVAGTRPYISTTVTSTLPDRESSWELSGFLSNISGMAKPFFVQGPLEVLTQSSLIGGEGSEVEIRLDPILSVERLLDISHVWIEDASGEFDIVKVTGAVELEDRSSIFTEATDLTPSKAWSAMVVRLSSDEVVETFLTDSLSEITLTFRELAEYE